MTVHTDDTLAFSRCYGFAHRAHEVANTPQTRFGIASGSKAFTALAVLRLIEGGSLSLTQPAREILGTDLPLIDDAVTIEHLLGHTSGIGDYLDEDGDWEPDEFVLPVPVHTLTTAEAFLPVLDGYPQAFEPGARFAYCNGGFAVLAIVLERVGGATYHELVDRLVLAPAGLTRTAFPRLDDLPADVASGYLYDTGNRTNTLHLPVLAAGDGGAIVSGDDLHAFWRAFHEGRIVSADSRDLMLTPRTFVEDEDMRYGFGMWLHRSGNPTILEGYDSGVSMRTVHLPDTRTTVSVLGNTSEGAWPVITTVTEAVDAALT